MGAGFVDEIGNSAVGQEVDFGEGFVDAVIEFFLVDGKC